MLKSIKSLVQDPTNKRTKFVGDNPPYFLKELGGGQPILTSHQKEAVFQRLADRERMGQRYLYIEDSKGNIIS